jgi:hypothetical protein
MINKYEQVYVTKYRRINSTNYSATCASKDREPSLMSRVGGCANSRTRRPVCFCNQRDGRATVLNSSRRYCPARGANDEVPQ